MARSILLRLLGEDASASRALANVGDSADDAADRLDRLDDSSRNADDGTNRLTATLGRMAPALGQAAGTAGLLAAGVGTAVPAVAGLAAAMGAVAPAAGVAVTAMGAMALAQGALKIGMLGVGEAVTAAFDPSKAAEFAEAMEKLSPQAQQFVGAIKELQPAFEDLKTGVQDALFQGLGPALEQAATVALPTLRTGLEGAAAALNGMGQGLLQTFTEIGGAGGPLEQLFTSATTGLGALQDVPGQLLQGLVQIGAAAGPLFERLTTGAAGFADRISAGLTEAFESGRLEGFIEQAAAAFGQLVDVAVNIGQVLGSVFEAANVSGGGLLGTLETITGAMAEAFASPEVQGGLEALFATMGQLASTAAPLLGQALAAIGPVLQALAPGAQALIAALGDGLQPIIAALGPVLEAAAGAVSALAMAFAPLLPVIGQLVAGLLPALTPFLDVLAQVFTQLAPVVQQVADNLMAGLAPILAQLPALAEPIATVMGQLAMEILPILGDLLLQLSPSLTVLGEAFGQVLAALAPLLAELAVLTGEALTALMPLIQPIITVVAELAAVFADELAQVLTGMVVPAIETVVAILQGDGEAALESFGQAALGAVESVVTIFATLPFKISEIMGRFAISLTVGAATAFARMNTAVSLGIGDIVRELAGLPPRAKSAVGDTSRTLYPAGVALARGMAAGVAAGASLVLAAVQQLRNMAEAGGRGAAQDMARGFSQAAPAAENSMTNSVNRMATGGGAGGGVTGGGGGGGGGPVGASRALGEKMALGVGDGFQLGASALPQMMLGALQLPIVEVTDKILKDLLEGSGEQVKQAIADLKDQVLDAFNDKVITRGQRDGLLDFLADSNKELLALVKEREEIVKFIEQVQDYAQEVTQKALDYAALTNIQGTDGNAATGAELVAGLQARLATVREFGANMQKLAKAGLSKGLLQQILGAGIDGGSAIAAELANGPNSIITALNETQAEIEEIADKLGLDSAEALFGAGEQTGEAFMEGLQSQQEAIVAAIEEMVAAIVQTLETGMQLASTTLQEMALGAADPGQFKAAAQAAVPKAAPAAPKPAPKPAPNPRGQIDTNLKRTVNVNFNGNTFRETANVGQVLGKAAFAARAATF